VAAMVSISLFLLFGIVAYAIIGMQLFGNRYTWAPKPRSNFDNIGSSLLILVQVLTGDDWQDPMYNALRSDAAWAAGPYFIGFHIVSTYIVLNLVVAALLFAISTAADRGETAFIVDAEDIPAPFRARLEAYYKKYSPDENHNTDELIDFYSGNEEPLWARLDQKFNTGFFDMSPLQQSDVLGIIPSNAADASHDPDATYHVLGIRANFIALGLMDPASQLRQNLQITVSSIYFWAISVCFVVAGNVVVFLESPSMRKNTDYVDIEKISMYVLVSWWGIEFILKVLADGFLWVRPCRDLTPVQSPKLLHGWIKRGLYPQIATDPATGEKYGERFPYLITGSNALDLLSLIAEIIDVVNISTGGPSVRFGLIARPMRLINVIPGVRDVIKSLARAGPALLNVLVFTNIGFAVFAIMGINMFAGFFNLCNDPSVSGESTCTGTYTAVHEVCTSGDNAADATNAACGAVFMPRVWHTYHRNFDYIWEAYFVLFEIGSLDKWVSMLHFTMDLTGSDTQPEQNNASYNAIFLVSFIFVGAIFMLKLFVAVIVDTYNQSYANSRSSGTAEAQENKLTKLLDLMTPGAVPERPIHSAIRKFSFDVCIPWDKHDPFMHGSQKYLYYVRTHFDDTMLLCILLNLVLMCSKHYGQPSWWGTVLDIQDIAFISIFMIEIILKSLAVLPWNYYKDPSNAFDATVVIGALIVWFIPGEIAAVFQRALKALRVARLCNASSRMRLIRTALMSAASGVGHVLLLLMIIFTTYAVLGVYAFGTVKYGKQLGVHLNFETLPNSLGTLLQVALGEWVELRYDCQIAAPQCTAIGAYDKDGVWHDPDCGTTWAVVYFFTFIVICKYVILNVIVAVVMESFTWLYSMERTNVTDDLNISVDDMRNYQLEWERLDPLGRGSIPISDVSVLVNRLPEPLGRVNVEKDWLDEIRFELESLPGHMRGRTRFKELFSVLATSALAAGDGHSGEGLPDISNNVTRAHDYTVEEEETENGEEEDIEMGALGAAFEAFEESRPVSRQDIAITDVSGEAEGGATATQDQREAVTMVDTVTNSSTIEGSGVMSEVDDNVADTANDVTQTETLVAEQFSTSAVVEGTVKPTADAGVGP